MSLVFCCFFHHLLYINMMDNFTFFFLSFIETNLTTNPLHKLQDYNSSQMLCKTIKDKDESKGL